MVSINEDVDSSYSRVASLPLSRRSLLIGASAAGLAAVLASRQGITFASGALAQDAPSLKVVSPADGATVATNDIQVQLEVGNFKLDGEAFGRPDQDGVGEILAFVDGATIAQLTNFYSTDSFTIAGDGLEPGKHTLAFVLASSTHVPNMDTAQQVTIDFQPPQPVPLPAANDAGDVSLKLFSPEDGATVPSRFPVQVTPVGFTPATALEGKANVPGYGHYHVVIDTPMEAGMAHSSLAGLVLMPGTNGFTLNLSAWGEGEHTIWIEPAQNDHSQYKPVGHVEFKVTTSAMASPEASPAADTGSPAAGMTIAMTDALQFEPSAVTIKAGTAMT